MAGASDRQSTSSAEPSRSIQLLERWVAGDDSALEEGLGGGGAAPARWGGGGERGRGGWWGPGAPPVPSGPWARIVAVAHSLSRTFVPHRGAAPQSDRLIERRGGARYKYPVEGR